MKLKTKVMHPSMTFQEVKEEVVGLYDVKKANLKFTIILGTFYTKLKRRVFENRYNSKSCFTFQGRN
jgi:hypothetical protein